MSTTAKLRELVEAAGASPADKKYTWHDITSAQRTLESRGPDLARLVLELSEALEPIMKNLLDTYSSDKWTPEDGPEEDFVPTPDDASWEEHCIPWSEVKRLRNALAAVEALKLT